MRVLVIAQDPKVSRRVAEELFPRDSSNPGTVREWTTADGSRIQAGRFGQDLTGRLFDRVVVAQQDKLPASYSRYLEFRLVPGGRFDRHD